MACTGPPEKGKKHWKYNMKPKHAKQFPGRVPSRHHSTSTVKAKLKRHHKKKMRKQSGSWTVELDIDTTKKSPHTFTISPYESRLDSAGKPSKKSSKFRHKKDKFRQPKETALAKHNRRRSESEGCLGDQEAPDISHCISRVSGEGASKEKSSKGPVGPLSLDALKQLGKLEEEPLARVEDSALEEYPEPDVEDEHQRDSDEETNDVEDEHQSDYEEKTDYFGGAYVYSSDEEVNASESASSASEDETELDCTEPMDSSNWCHTSANSSAYCADSENEEEGYSQLSLHPEQSKHTLRVFSLQEKLLLAFVRQPTMLRLTGRATLRVLYGSLDVDGYILTPANPHNKDGLFVQCGLLSPPATMRPMAPQSDSVYSKLMQELNQLVPGSWDTVSPHFDRNATVVLLKKAEGRWPAIELVIANLVKLPHLESSHAGMGFDLKSAKDDHHPWSSQFPGLATKLIKATTSAEQQIPHVVVCGMKNSGKSTFLRQLTNSLLNVCSAVIYLDCDPGQTEFSPPGTLSLVKVTHPLLGPPFTHVCTPEKMYFLGDVSPAASPDSYSNAIRCLVEYKNQHFPSCPLVVNTMGWLYGIGMSLFVDIIRWVNPTDLVQLVSAFNLAGSVSPTDLPLLNASTVHMACGWLSSRNDALPEGHDAVLGSSFASHHLRAVEGKSSSSQPQILRQGMLLSYLSQKQCSSAFCPWSLTPYRLAWSSVAIHEHSCTVQKKDLLHVLNASVVALCTVPKESLLETEVEGYPMFMKGNPPYECVGFGIVRAIHPKEKVFYILTPEPKHRLAEVNALIKGCINIPEVLLTKQARFLKKGQSLPYLANSACSEVTSYSDNQMETRSRSESPCY
ncbi:polynucleotide 5'-hydroxyl-kinase NOL9-like isoform X2 [Ornithodoros turicata]|uniref:polynucleotide 5'-hydroxyl-kinase NOL9-like isoform X2 n=1 Tax=Ornithodoros turicata TaxID=34597 RepID=UPI00313981AD